MIRRSESLLGGGATLAVRIRAMTSTATARHGHHFLLGLQPSPALTDHDRRLLAEVRPAGIILFKQNFRQDLPYDGWFAEYEKLLRDCGEAIGREKFFVCIDHEGGTVVRPPAPITQFGWAVHWRDAAAEVGAAVGIELASLGINVNFAPVVDVDSNAANPVIADRAFSTDPEEVSRVAAAYIHALQSQGVLACPKHFPGHGDTDADSHFDLPLVSAPKSLLTARELVPYRAILDDVSLIMSAHIVFSEIDSERPATVSRRILSGVLRDELGFRGAVISDDIGMRGADPFFRKPDGALQAILAGCDVIAICAAWTDTGRLEEMARNVTELAETDYALETLAASAARINGVLDSLSAPRVTRLDESVFEAHRRVAPLYDGAGRRNYAGINA